MGSKTLSSGPRPVLALLKAGDSVLNFDKGVDS